MKLLLIKVTKHNYEKGLCDILIYSSELYVLLQVSTVLFVHPNNSYTPLFRQKMLIFVL